MHCNSPAPTSCAPSCGISREPFVFKLELFSSVNRGVWLEASEDRLHVAVHQDGIRGPTFGPRIRARLIVL
eukprot:1075528-Amorphochlora_amoeboformis.AAC.1